MRQIAMVIDLNKCIGCQTCTAACKSMWTDEGGQEYMLWNNVETQPGRGYPKNWQEKGAQAGWKDGKLQYGPLHADEDYGSVQPLNHEQVYFKGEAPRLQREPMNYGANWDEDTSSGDYPNNYHFYMPRLCNHCTKPACLAACPNQAIYKREQDGIVLIDQDKCKGARLCNLACPYDKVYFNFLTNKSQKCVFCFPRLEQGVAPACARQCPGRLRFVGFLDDPDGPIDKLVNKWKVALPLHAEYGTGPNVYYVPPLLPSAEDAEGRFTDRPRLPTEFLRRLFGPGVDAALGTLKAEMDRRRSGEPSELMDLLIARDWKSLFKIEDARRPAAPGAAPLSGPSVPVAAVGASTPAAAAIVATVSTAGAAAAPAGAASAAVGAVAETGSPSARS
jgi:nitrate reductase beta subunit